MARLLVTGASGGLGTAVTTYLLAQGHWVVAVGSRPSSLSELPDHPHLRTHAADITTAEGAASMAEVGIREFGGIDGLAHLVGGFAMAEFGSDESVEAWDRMFRLNTDAAFHCFRAALPALVESRGAIVAVSSQSVKAPGAQLAAYAASKAALEAMVKSLAAETRSQGVRVNAVAPGTINTAANRAAMGEKHAASWVQPEKLASIIALLLSNDASDITGAILEVSGGA